MSDWERAAAGAKLIILFPITLPLVTIGIIIRLINEVTTRVFGRTFVVCPYCGMPGIAITEHPQVLQ